MNDEIKEAAEIYAYRECCETEYNSRTDDLENGFIDGANYATEKCQKEIKRLNVMIMKMADYIHDEDEEGSLCDEAYRLMSK